MRYRSRQRAIRAAIAKYAPLVTSDGDLDKLLAAVSAEVGRPIRSAPMTAGGGLSGVMVSFQDSIWIGYDATAPAPVKRHVVLHELGHVILGHPLINADDLDAATASGRCPYPSALNRDADQFAHDLLHAAGDLEDVADADGLQRAMRMSS